MIIIETIVPIIAAKNEVKAYNEKILPPIDFNSLVELNLVIPLTKVKKVRGTINIFNSRINTLPIGSKYGAIPGKNAPRKIPKNAQTAI